MDSNTEMGSYDSGMDSSIPLVVKEEPVDSTFMLVRQLKNISSDIEQIKSSLSTMDELHQQVDWLTDSMGYLVRQNNSLREVTQKSLQRMSRDLKTLRNNQAPMKRNEGTKQAPKQGNVVDSTTDSMKYSQKVNKGQRPSIKQQWSHIVHIEEALQENIVSFVEQMAFRNTPLPDKLIENECLSEDECSVIRAKHDKDQIRHLLHKLIVRGPETIVNFLNVIRDNDYSFLAEKVHTSLNRLKEERKDENIDCLVCHVKQKVDLRDVGDYLFKVKMIKRGTYGDIIDSRTLHENREYIWHRIINDVNKSENFELAMGHIKVALSGKYDYLVNFLTETKSTVLQCSCSPKRRRRRHTFTSEFGSQTDLSTTSEIPHFEKFCSYDGNSEADSTSDLSSLEFEASYADLSKYKRMAKRPDVSKKYEPNSSTLAGDGPFKDIKTNIYEPDTTSNKRSRHNTGEFNTGQEIDEIMEGFQRQQSTLYVDVVNSDSIAQSPESTTKSALQKSISQNSTLTVRPANSTESSGDTQCLTEGSGTQSAISQSQTTETPIDEKTIEVLVEGSKAEPDMTLEKHGNAQDQTSNEALEEITRYDGSVKVASFLLTKSRTGLTHETPQEERRVCKKKKKIKDRGRKDENNPRL